MLLSRDDHSLRSIVIGLSLSMIPSAFLIFVAGIVSGFFFFKQKTAYDMAQCDWSSDVCSSDLLTIFADCDSANPRSAQGTQQARCSRLNPRRSVTLNRSDSVPRRARTASTSSCLTASIIRGFEFMKNVAQRFRAADGIAERDGLRRTPIRLKPDAT